MFCSGIIRLSFELSVSKLSWCSLIAINRKPICRENALKVGAGFYVVTAKTAEIADYRHLILPLLMSVIRRLNSGLSKTVPVRPLST